MVAGDNGDGTPGPFSPLCGGDAPSTSLTAGATPAAATVSAQEQLLRAWVTRITLKDQAAMAEVYDAMVTKIRALAFCITRNTALADEVVADTFWQVWREAPRFDAERGCVSAWITTIGRSRALDSLRRRSASAPEQTTQPSPDWSESDAADPLDIIESQQTGQLLHAALLTLEHKDRQVVAMAFFRGLSHTEIAAQTRQPLGTVKSQIRRALLTLRTALARDHDGV